MKWHGRGSIHGDGSVSRGLTVRAAMAELMPLAEQSRRQVEAAIDDLWPSMATIA